VFHYFHLTQFCCFAALESYPWSQVHFDWQDAATLIILFLTLFSMALEIRPPGISMLLGVLSLLILGILNVKEFLSGFSHDLLFTIAMLCVVVRAVEVNGVLDILAKNALPCSKNLKASLLRLLIPVGVTSAFLNSTAAVLLFTPKIRRFAKAQGFTSSQFLIPISYIASLGGMCTLIGTSTNLIVEELVHNAAQQTRLSFFELSYIGVPAFLLGLAYLLTVGVKLIPKREDPVSKAESELRSYTAEFKVRSGSSLEGKTLRDARYAYFRSEMIVQIERASSLIDSPSEDMVIMEGDRLVFAGDINHIADLYRIEGLQSEADPHFTLDSASSHFAEVVISPTSYLIGKTLREVHFRTCYGASCLAIYRQGERVSENVGNILLLPGDVLILLSSDQWEGNDGENKDFYSIKENKNLKSFNPVRDVFIFVIVAGFLCFAAAGFPLPLCAVTAAAFLIGLGFITIQEAQKSISWNLLLLIGCSFAMAQAIVKTGIAASLASSALPFTGTNPHFVIGSILLITILSTEFFSNNAMAIILFPIALDIARLAGYGDFDAVKAVGVAVAVGCSLGFSTPTGYRTHLIVYSQGGYRFTDFLRVGIFLDLLILLLAALLIPWIWPMGSS